MNARWWFYVKDGQQHSVPALADLVAALESGEIDAATVIWRQGLPEWLPAGSVEELTWFFAGDTRPPAEQESPAESRAETTDPTRSAAPVAGEAGFHAPPPLPGSAAGSVSRRLEFGASLPVSRKPGE
ncbi:MAG TPA: DUF4339 domain-containing protein, partial [Candidatus Krumholzibacteria bacterium]